MQLVFLGTGASVPSPRRNVSALAVKLGSDVVLFDCGEGTQRQMMSSNASYMKIERVLITHLHGDHFLGLPGMMQTMHFSGRERKLEVIGPPGTVDMVRSVMDLGECAFGYDVEVRELEGGEVLHFPGYSITAVRADHSVYALSYVLEEDMRPGRFRPEEALALGIPAGPMYRMLQEGETIEYKGVIVTPEEVIGPPRKGRKVAISGDTRPNEAFARAAWGADVMVHEATLDDSHHANAAEYGHSTSVEAAEVALKARVKTLYLTHISARYEDASILEREARAIFSNTVLAEDLMTVDVPLPD